MFKYLLFCVLVMRYYVIYLRGSWLLIYYRRKESRICSLFLYIMFVFAWYLVCNAWSCVAIISLSVPAFISPLDTRGDVSSSLINFLSILLIYCPCITLLSYFFFKDSPNLSYVYFTPSPFVSLLSFVQFNSSATSSATLIIIFVFSWLLSWILIIQILYILLLLDYVLFTVDLKGHNCPSARCAAVSDAISRNIGVFKGKNVLFYDLLIMFSIYTKTLLCYYCFFFRIPLLSCIMFLATCFLYFFLYWWCPCHWRFGCCFSTLIVRNWIELFYLYWG